MKPSIRAVTLSLVAVACWALLGCSSPSSTLEVGTNTSWLMVCEEDAECGSTGSCRCGICTDSCASDEDCGSGVCGSELATNGQCRKATQTRICLPPPAADAATECTVLPVSADDDLQLVESTCSTPNALVCESFDAPLPEGYSTWYGDEVVAAVQDCQVARGAGALRLQSSVFGYSQTRIRLPSPASEGALHVRLFGYFGEAFVIPKYVALFELWTNDDGPPKISLDAIGNNQLEINLSPFSSVFVSPEGVLRRNEWLCLELAVDLRVEGGSVSLAIDGTPIIEETGVVTSPGEPFTVAVIEASPSTDSTGVDIAFDELVIATEPIGCD